MVQTLRFVVHVDYRREGEAGPWRREVRAMGWNWLAERSETAANPARECVRWLDAAGGPPRQLGYVVGLHDRAGDSTAAALADATFRHDFPGCEIVG